MSRSIAALLAGLLLASPARAVDFTVNVDARDTARGLLHVTQTFPARPGAMAFSYARWIGAFRQCPVLFIDVREYDLVAEPSAAAEGIASRVRQRLERELPQTELWPAVQPGQANSSSFVGFA